MAPLYLEDFTVGRRFETGKATVNAQDIKAFASQFDPQPFHLDERAAQESWAQGLVASGWHTASLTMRLLVESGPPIAGGLVGIGGELTWPQPVRPGDELRVLVDVVEVTPSRSRPTHGRLKMRAETLNQRGEAVQIATMVLLVPRNPGLSDRAAVEAP